MKYYHLLILSIHLALSTATASYYTNEGLGDFKPTFTRTLPRIHSDTSLDSDIITIGPNSSALFVFDIPKDDHSYGTVSFVFPKIEGVCHDYYLNSEWPRDLSGDGAPMEWALVNNNKTNCTRNSHTGLFDILQMADHSFDIMDAEIDAETINENTTWTEISKLNWYDATTDSPNNCVTRNIEDDSVILPAGGDADSRTVFRMDSVWGGTLQFNQNGNTTWEFNGNTAYRRAAVGMYIKRI